MIILGRKDKGYKEPITVVFCVYKKVPCQLIKDNERIIL